MISATIITLNEEKNIEACISSIAKVCNEIIVVDSGSTDHTTEIAKRMGAIIVNQPYLGDGFQRNIAANHSSNKWILNIDADERLSDEMINFINSFNLVATEVDAFSFRRRNIIGSRWIKHCGWYPDYCTRLYNSETTSYPKVKQHAKIKSGKISYIKHDIIHFSFRNIGELFSKPGRNFSTRGAKIMYQQGKKANALSPFIHGLNAFIRKYIFQRGFMGGVDGMTVALSSGVNSYLKYAKLLELKRDNLVLRQENFDSIW